MDWMKKHIDTVIILGGILSAMVWIQGKFEVTDGKINGISTELALVKNDVAILKSDVSQLKNDVGQLKTEMAVVKSVLIMKNIMPQELAPNTE